MISPIRAIKKVRWYIWLFLSLLLWGFSLASAQTFPHDTRTCVRELVGASSYVCEVDDDEIFTILSVKMMQSGTASSTDLLCGTNVVARNYAKDYEQAYFNYVCNSSISFSKTGNDSSFLQVMYLPYDVTVTGNDNSNILFAVQTMFLLVVLGLAMFGTFYIIKRVI